MNGGYHCGCCARLTAEAEAARRLREAALEALRRYDAATTGALRLTIEAPDLAVAAIEALRAALLADNKPGSRDREEQP
jgi:hypothetical protein